MGGEINDGGRRACRCAPEYCISARAFFRHARVVFPQRWVSGPIEFLNFALQPICCRSRGVLVALEMGELRNECAGDGERI